MSDLGGYLGECRERVLPQIQRMIPEGSPYRGVLYDRMMEYALRDAKMLRPAICIATCRALGGRLEEALPSAAVLELYHNAFLVHDDVEDFSEKRRDLPTLHGMYGVPIAVNVGDAMLALALEPLLDNMRTVGMGKALRVLQAVQRMARESAEGQAIELEWVREGSFGLGDEAYVHMVEKKTSYYSFVIPAAIGAILAGAPASFEAELERFALVLGVAFQIQDDILNLTGDYGKEARGDLWEGKHTLILMHMMRSATPRDQARAQEILRKPRPLSTAREGAIAEAVARLEREGAIGAHACAVLREAISSERAPAKTAEDVGFLGALIDTHGSIEYARAEARRRAAVAGEAFAALGDRLRPSTHRDFLGGLVDYVVTRSR